jgi:hypothetical protein
VRTEKETAGPSTPVGMTKDGVAITWKVVAGHEAITLYQTIALSLSSRPERRDLRFPSRFPWEIGARPKPCAV